MELTTLAVILCKSFSERVYNKNRVILGKKRLYKWTTDFLEKHSYLFDAMVFSSDDCSKFAYDKNKFYTVHRNVELANKSTMVSLRFITKHFEKIGKKYDRLMLFQPTNPLRHVGYIKEALNYYKKDSTKNIICSHYIDDNLDSFYIKHIFPKDGYTEVKIKSGNFYLYNWDYITDDLIPSYYSIRIPKELGYNINTELDFEIVETFLIRLSRMAYDYGDASYEL